jgi:hypothetical protein
MDQVKEYISPMTVITAHEALISNAMQANQAAACLADLLEADPNLLGALLAIGQAEHDQPTVIPDSQELAMEDPGSSQDLQAVIGQGRTANIANHRGARTLYYLPTTTEFLAAYPEGRATWLAKHHVAFAFNKSSMYSRTKGFVISAATITWLRDAFPGLRGQLEMLGHGRVVVWCDIAKANCELASTDMPVALPELSWLLAHAAQQGINISSNLATDMDGFDGTASVTFSEAPHYPMPALLYMLWYHPKTAMPAASGTVEQARKQVLHKLATKPGANSQVAREIDDLVAMLLRYMLVQSEVVPAVYKYGTGPDSAKEMNDGVVLFYPDDPTASTEDYCVQQVDAFNKAMQLAEQYAEPVRNHVSGIQVSRSINGAATLNMGEYAVRLAKYVMVPSCNDLFRSVFTNFKGMWSKQGANRTTPQLHRYDVSSGNLGQYKQEQLLTEGVLRREIARLKSTAAGVGDAAGGAEGLGAAGAITPGPPGDRGRFLQTPSTINRSTGSFATAGGSHVRAGRMNSRVNELQEQANALAAAAAEARQAADMAAAELASAAADEAGHDGNQQQFTAWQTPRGRGGRSQRISGATGSSSSGRGGWGSYYGSDSGRGYGGSYGHNSGGRGGRGNGRANYFNNRGMYGGSSSRGRFGGRGYRPY